LTTTKNTTKMAKIGDRIRIIALAGEGTRYQGMEGEVTSIDSLGQLHGTWGGLAIIPEEDEYIVMEKGGDDGDDK